MGVRIAEAFGQERAETVKSLPLLGQAAHGQTHAAGGHVGLAAFVQDEEAAELDDEGKAVGPRQGIPVNPFVPILEPEGGTRPAQHRTQTRQAFLGGGLVNALPEDVSGWASGFEVVLRVEGITQLRNLKFRRGGPDFKALRGLIQCRAKVQRVHGPANMTKSASMSRKISKNLEAP